MNGGKERGIFVKALFSLIPLVVFMILLEGGARLLPPVKYQSSAAGFMGDKEGLFQEDPLLMWRVRPNLEGRHATNSGGFRGAEFPKKKAPDEFRVLVLGDSTTWGWGIPGDAVYPARLDKLLVSDGFAEKVSVINGGMPGYSSLQGRRLFETELKKYKPDFVVTFFGVNDSTARPGMPRDSEHPAKPLPIINMMRMLRKSKLYSDARKGALQLKEKRKQSEPINTVVRRVSPEEFNDNLAAIEKEAAAIGAPVVHIVPAWFLNGIMRNDTKLVLFSAKGTYTEHTGSVPMYSKRPSLDILPEFKASGLDGNSLFLDYCHLSPEGHRILAEKLAKYISAAKLK